MSRATWSSVGKAHSAAVRGASSAPRTSGSRLATPSTTQQAGRDARRPRTAATPAAVSAEAMRCAGRAASTACTNNSPPSFGPISATIAPSRVRPSQTAR